MKKYRIFSLILCLVLITASFCGCDFKINLNGDKGGESTTASQNGGIPAISEDDVTVSPSTAEDIKKQVDSFSDEEVKKNNEFFTIKDNKKPSAGISSSRVDEGASGSSSNDENVINSNVFTVSGRIVDGGDTSYYKMARNGDKLSVMAYYNGSPIGFILNGNNVYIVNSADEVYYVMSKKLLEAADSSGTLGSFFNNDISSYSKKVVSEGTETVDGKKLTYKQYDDGTYTYFSGNVIVMTKTEEGSVIYYDEISSEAPDSLFLPPKGYKMQQLIDGVNNNE